MVIFGNSNYIWVDIDVQALKMLDLVGSYPVKFDNKGRVRLPKKLLEDLGSGGTHAFFVNRGVGKCLSLYTEDAWNRETREMRKLNLRIVKNRELVRDFFHFAKKVELDRVERINVPNSLLDYAGIENEAVIQTFFDQIEIWSKEEYEKRDDIKAEDFAERIEDLVGRKEEERKEE